MRFDSDDVQGQRDFERRAAELSAVLKSLPDAVYIGTAAGITFTNEVGYRMLGFQSEADLLQEIPRLGTLIQVREANTGRPVPPEELVFARALGGESATQEVLVRNVSTGEDLIVRSSASPVVLGDRILGAVAINTDITRHKRAEAELRYQFDAMNGIMRSAAEGIFLMDREGRVTFANPAAESMFGWGAGELEGKLLHDVLHHREREECALGRIFSEGKTVRDHEDVFFRKDGNPVAVVCSNSPLLASRDAGGAVLVVRDITERKRAEERLRETQKLESIGLLAAGVAHDFNNLLVGILGNASLLMDSKPADSPDRPFLENIEKAGERAAELTRQLLAYSGKGRFLLEAVDLGSLAERTRDLLSAPVSKKIDIVVETEAPARVHADAGQMQQLLVNLVSNAAEAIGDNPGRISIRLRREWIDESTAARHFAQDGIAPGAYICLEVKDTGPGMDEELQARIFDPFFTTKFLGRGLGLAAVQGIVRGHSGVIRVHSSPDKGSTFSVLLPAIQESVTDAEPVRIPRDRGTVLLVDDEEVVRRTAKLALERHGFEVLVGSDGREGVEMFSRNPDGISLVILDMAMPVMDGNEAISRIRALRGDVPVIVISGYSHEEALWRFRGKGVNAFLQKPFTPRSLRAKIDEVMGGRSGGDPAGHERARPASGRQHA